jgi:hypothetical protein
MKFVTFLLTTTLFITTHPTTSFSTVYTDATVPVAPSCREIRADPDGMKAYDIHAGDKPTALTLFQTKQKCSVNNQDWLSAILTPGFIIVVPKRIEWWLDPTKFLSTRPQDQSYRITSALVFGQVEPDVVCDGQGNAVFFKGAEDAKISPPQSYEVDGGDHSQHDMKRSFAYEPTSQDAKSINEQPYLSLLFVTTVACVSKGNMTSSQRSVMVESISSHVVWPSGELTPQQFADLSWNGVFLLPRFILAVWLTRQWKEFREYVLTQQKILLVEVWIGLGLALMRVIILGRANETGAHNFNEESLAYGTFLLFNWINVQVFHVILLLTARGWGVVKPSLQKSDARPVAIYFCTLLVLLLAVFVFHSVLALLVLVFLSDVAVWMWIWISLKQTQRQLVEFSRPDSGAKADMYKRLQRLIVRCAGAFVALIVIFFIVAVFNIKAAALTPESLFEVPGFILIAGFAYIWRPSPSTAIYSYFAQREGDAVVLEAEEVGISGNSNNNGGVSSAEVELSEA